MPLPPPFNLIVPNFQTADPKADENWRALDRWQAGILPGGIDLISRETLPLAKAGFTLNIPPRAAYESIILQATVRASSASGLPNVRLQFNDDTTIANYTSLYSGGTAAGSIAGRADASAGIFLGNSTDTIATALHPSTIWGLIGNYKRPTTFTRLAMGFCAAMAGGANDQVFFTGGLWVSAAAITKMFLTAPGTTFAANSVCSWYGVL